MHKRAFQTFDEIAVIICYLLHYIFTDCGKRFYSKKCWWRSELIRPFTNEPQMIERNNISKNFSQFNIRRKEKKRELFFPNFTSISFSPLCDMKRKKFEDRTTPFPSKRKDWSPDCTLWFTIFLPSRMRFKRDWSWNDPKKMLSDFCQKNSYFAKCCAIWPRQERPRRTIMARWSAQKPFPTSLATQPSALLADCCAVRYRPLEPSKSELDVLISM